jgi:hypothetical protein
MNVAVLADAGNADGTIGGAELTMCEFANAAPEDVTLTDLDQADAVVIGNCVSFDAALIADLEGKHVVRYHNDLARHEHPALREWLEQHAAHVFTSPLHQSLYGLDGDWPNIPPPIDAAAFRPSRQHRRNGKRSGACAIAPWQNPGKGQQLLKEWSDEHEPVDVFGAGVYTPTGPNLRNLGPLMTMQVAETLWQYETFVHLPTAPEPFGRAVVEAHYAGCRLVVNRLVGALHYLENEPDALESAAADFWALVTRAGVTA